MNINSENTNVGLRHLRAVLAIEANGTFAAAAAALGVVPSALTETVRQVELETGTQLFDRTCRPVRATQAGQLFLREADRIVRQFDGALHSLRVSGGLARGHVGVATIPSALGKFLSPAIRSLRESNPGTRLSIFDGIGSFTEEMVLADKAELGLTARWSTKKELSGTLLGKDPYCVVFASDHELAGWEGPIPLHALDRPDAIGIGAGNAITLQLANEAALPQSLRTPDIQTHSTIAQLQLVRSGYGFALLPEMAARTLGSGGLVIRPLSDLVMERDIFLIQRVGQALSPTAEVLRQHLLNAPRRQP